MSLLITPTGVFIGCPVGSGTAGSIPFIDTGPILAQANSSLFYDKTNKRAGFGTNSPQGTVEAMATSATEIALIAQGAVSQSANIFEAQDSSANKMLVIAPLGQIQYAAFNETVTAVRTYIGSTSTITNQGVAMSFVAFTGTIQYSAQPAFGIPPELFAFRCNFKVNALNMTLSQPQVFVNGTTFTADGFIWTGAENGGTFTDQPTFSIANSGSYTGVVYNAFRSTFTINTGAAIDTRRGMRIDDATGAGTLTTQHGILINDLTKGTTNIPIYQKGATGHNRMVAPTNFGADSAATHNVDIQGSLGLKFTSTSSTSYTVLVSDLIVHLTSSSARTVNLPAAATAVARKTYIIKDANGNAATNNITVDGNASETIDGSLTKVINTNYGSIRIYTDGSNWFTI